MPNPDTVQSKRLDKKNFSLLMLFNFFLAFVGSLFLAWNGVTAGIIYSLMFVGVMACLFLVFIFLRDDNSLKPITNYVSIPIATKLTLSAFLYISGMILPFLIDPVLKVFGGGFSVSSFSVPLFGQSIISGARSYATAVINNSMPWKIYNMMFVAGNMETLVFNFGLILVFILIGFLILKLINGGEDLPFMRKRTFVLGFSFVMVTILFALSHVMNGSYGFVDFIVAGAFLLIANVSIYLAGIFLSFWAGFHQSANLLYLIKVEGLATVMSGFVSWFGLIFIIYIALIIFFLLRNSDKVGKDLKEYVR